MDETSSLMVKRYFKEYYFRNSGKIEAPSEIEKREFGYFPFGGQMIRHLSFKDIGSFRALLFRESPAGVYCSNSLYLDPTLEMHKKQWIRAEMIFDIDADALHLPCKKEHDIWLCKQCGRKEFGLRPETCPNCKGNRILEMTWACPNCLEGTKKETFKLLDFLESDFGVSGSNIRIFFSGNAGYHVSVAGSSFESLDQRGRSEISDYLTAQGILTEMLFSPRMTPSDPGWRGRMARYIRDLPERTPPFEGGTYDLRIHELANEFTKSKSDKFLTQSVSQLSVKIDPMVTTDIHRIFRMPETLNNKTGLVKRECKDLGSFVPLAESIAVPGENEKYQVMVDLCPKIHLGGNYYGPYKSEMKELPYYVAVYIVSKGAGKFLTPAPELSKMSKNLPQQAAAK